jgi:acyl-CoA thioesterase
VAQRLDQDTAITALGDGIYAARIDRGWWIERGPNGGFVAALVLRALGATAASVVEGPPRPPRSLTVHYLSPPREGAVRLETEVERNGRQITFVSGRLRQDDRLLAIAQAAFSAPIPGAAAFDDTVPPSPPAPEELAAVDLGDGPAIPMRDRYEMRWVVGAPPPARIERAEAGGWIRLAEPQRADHLLLTVLTDAWMPPLFSRLGLRVGVPTIDLTIHFRTADVPDVDWFFVRFSSRFATEGFVEEDGEVWSRDGHLLAQSRQLAAVLPA